MSGGPVTSYHGRKHILEGIVGFGATECRGSNTPSKWKKFLNKNCFYIIFSLIGLFLKVAPFAEWIEQTMEGKVKAITTTTTTTSTTPEPECDDVVCD